jgi:DNA polymerase III subunit beta
MQFDIQKTELLAVVKRVLPFVERKCTIPILANVKVTAAGDSITVVATDLENSLTVTRSAHVATDGAVTIPARKLSDVLTKIKSLDADTVSISADENAWVTLSCGPLKVKLPGMKVENFPVLPTFPNGKTSEIPGAVVAGLIHRVQHASATEESRYTLNGAQFTVEADRVRMVATDGHRLAFAEHSGTFANPMQFLITIKAVALLKGLLDSGTVTVARDETTIYMCANDWQLTTRILTGQFPRWEMVMPKDNAKRVILPAKALKESLARVAAFADERSKATKWQLIGGKGIQLSASSSETGDASELIAASCEDDATVGLSAEYVTDILSTIEKDQDVTLAVKSADYAVLWTPNEPNGFTTKYVLMPMRI